jgi:hypothetical protein
MALGDTYATLAELKTHVGIPVDEDMKDEVLQWALDSASREIENCCERQFNKTTTASQRTYRLSCDSVEVDDFWTTDGLVIDGNAYAADDYDLWPLNGTVNGVPGWPYGEIVSYGRHLPDDRVTVTAQWGWDAVPAPVKQACLMLAAKNYKLADSPLGVAGFGEFGVVRVRDMPDIDRKLKKYKRIVVHVG